MADCNTEEMAHRTEFAGIGRLHHALRESNRRRVVVPRGRLHLSGRIVGECERRLLSSVFSRMPCPIRAGNRITCQAGGD